MAMRDEQWKRWASLLVAFVLLSCTRGEKTATTTAASATATTTTTSPPRESAIIDFLAPLAAPFGGTDDCVFGHRGYVLDLGDPSMRSHMAGTHLAMPDVEVREHEGASWVNVRARTLELSFVADAETEPGVVISARVRGGAAKSASVYLNGKPIGQLVLSKGETTVLTAHAPTASILKGSNDLMLRFNGGAKAARDMLAEIDWIRVGPNDADTSSYAAPTRTDVVTTVSIGGAPKRAASLRAPGFARCTAFVPSGSMLEGWVGATGGEAEAEVRVLVDRAEPRVVGSFHLGGPGDPPGWRPIALPLGDIGTLAAVELVAKTSSKGTRIAFAEVRVTAPAEPARTSTLATQARARGVVLVVLGSMSRRLVALHGGNIAMPELASLAAGGSIFDAHRATSSFASGAMGSMLTGLSPRAHGAADGDAALSASVFTVAEAARQAGIVTAMFTANPTTTAPFGFARGWETFGPRLPAEDATATAVFDDVGAWLDTHKADRFFLVVHARGGHPPWDVTSEELKELPPAGYNGSLEPKHAGEALAKARKAGMGRLFADPDRERAFALHGKALAAHDVALGALVAHLKTLGRDKDTAWIVTGDIGVDAAAHVPFLEEESLEENALAVPLVLRGVDGAHLKEHVDRATSSVDIAPTILEALGLPPPALAGQSLWSLAEGRKSAVERPLIAETTTRFSARWGSFAVLGAKDREVKVCNLSLDPDCATDVRPSHALAAEALHALAWSELVAKAPPKTPAATAPSPSPARPEAPAADASSRVVADGPTSAALKVWGR